MLGWCGPGMLLVRAARNVVHGERYAEFTTMLARSRPLRPRRCSPFGVHVPALSCRPKLHDLRPVLARARNEDQFVGFVDDPFGTVSLPGAAVRREAMKIDEVGI